MVKVETTIEDLKRDISELKTLLDRELEKNFGPQDSTFSIVRIYRPIKEIAEGAKKVQVLCSKITELEDILEKKQREEIIHIARELVTYYSITRQVGHTSIMIDGLNHKSSIPEKTVNGCIVIVHDRKMVNILKNKTENSPYNIDYITLKDISYGGLRGMSKPIVWDNAALHIFLNDLLSYISKDDALTYEEMNKHELAGSLLAQVRGKSNG